MARKKNPTSTRQLGVAYCSKHNQLPRVQLIDNMRMLFPVAAEAYLETIWATHRRESKENGSLIEIFYVRDRKDGKTVKPYLKTEWLFNPASDASFSADEAIFQYIVEQENKIESSLGL